MTECDHALIHLDQLRSNAFFLLHYTLDRLTLLHLARILIIRLFMCLERDRYGDRRQKRPLHYTDINLDKSRQKKTFHFRLKTEIVRTLN